MSNWKKKMKKPPLRTQLQVFNVQLGSEAFTTRDRDIAREAKKQGAKVVPNPDSPFGW